MTSIAIVILSGKENKDIKSWHLFRFIMLKLRYVLKVLEKVLKRQNSKSEVKKVKLYDEMDLYIIDLPYTTDTLLKSGYRRVNKVKKLINRICKQYSIDNLILPVKLEESFQLDLKCRDDHSGQFLYKSLIINMLDEIYTKRGIRVFELDLTIVKGKNDNELYEVIKLLSSISKYITVICDKKENISKELDGIYSDSGLAIRVTDDFKSGLKYADCIINLGGLKEFIINSYVKEKTLIINCGDLNKNKVLSNNTLVNGIVIDLPVNILRLLGKTKWDEYNKLNIAEAILIRRICNKNEINLDSDDYRLMGLISKEFNDEGYRIKGFIGRNGMLDIKI